MESSNSRRWEKRGYEQSEEDSEHPPASKRPKLPALASVIVDALKIDSVQRLSSSLEPLLRRIVSEEVERALTKFGHAALPGRPSPPRIQGPEGRNLQLHFKTRMPPHLFTGGKVEGEQGAAIHVVLLDVNAGSIVQTGPESAAKLNIVVLEGDFNEEAEENWMAERFESQEVKEREGKRPLLNGELHIVLKNGIGTLGDLTFTDNSSWIRSRKFRLGVKVAPGYCEEIRVREAKTEAFAVKDHRGELYKKHYPPALHDEVWRLDRIAKDGALHKKLVKADIVTVEDFLRVLVRDSQRLRNILGSGMSNRMWENTAEHAKTCVLGRKLYVYYTDETRSTGVVFNHIYELRGLIAEGQFLSLESLTHSQKINVDTLVKRAYEHWNQVVEYDGKVLNSLTRGPVLSDNFITDHQFNNAQSRQQYIPLEPSPPSVPELIEFPFARSNEMAMMPMNDPQTALSAGMAMDYTSAGTPYYPGDSRNEQGMEDFFAEDIRLRSSEMLESDDMQRLLRTFGVGNEGFHSYSVQYEEPLVEKTFGQEQGRSSSGKAVVGWLKLKAALRWGIFVRKRAAERRAQLTELD